MKYKLFKLGSYNLHLIKTTKFKTLFFKLVFTKELKKEEITICNLLLDNLIFSNKNIPSKKEMAIKKQDLYGLDVYGNNRRIGKYLLTEIYMSILNPKYTEISMLDQSINFFKDIIFNPNVFNNHFDMESFNLIKTNLVSDIKSVKEDTSIYASTRLKEEMDKESPFSYKMEGYLEELNKINSYDLYNYYKKFMKENNIDIFVIGNFDVNDMEKMIKNNFKFENKPSIINDVSIYYKNSKKGIKEIIENSKHNQSKLAIGCSLSKLTKKEKKYVTTIYNIILGNSPDSKFFKNIREKQSFAYSISSGFRRMDDIMTITAGISYKNYENVVKSIKEEMNQMRLGNFSMNDIDKAKQLYISVINDINEFQSSISEYYYNLKYLNLDKINKELQEVNSVTKEEIVKVAKKIKIDTIYLLKEGTYEEN